MKFPRSALALIGLSFVSALAHGGEKKYDYIEAEKVTGTTTGNGLMGFGDFGTAAYDLRQARQAELWFHYRLLKNERLNETRTVDTFKIGSGTVAIGGETAERLFNMLQSDDSSSVLANSYTKRDLSCTKSVIHENTFYNCQINFIVEPIN